MEMDRSRSPPPRGGLGGSIDANLSAWQQSFAPTGLPPLTPGFAASTLFSGGAQAAWEQTVLAAHFPATLRPVHLQQPFLQPQVQTQFHPQLQPLQAHLQPQPQLQPQLQSQLNPQLQAQLQSQSAVQVPPQLQTQVQTQLQPQSLQSSVQSTPGVAHTATAQRANAVPSATQDNLKKLQEAWHLQNAVDTSEGYFEATTGYVVTGGQSDYTIVDKKALGVGVFSVVYAGADAENKLVAVKMVRRQDHFRKHAMKEVQILEKVRKFLERDSEAAENICQLKEHFMHNDYLCMVFEKLQANLRSLGQLPLDKVLSYSKQMLLSLRYLHDTVGLVHCDIKPDNLLLRHDGLAVKLCDFGTARPSADLQLVDELQPLFYRAPEVFVGATRGRKIDIWSAGCTIYELIVGRVLFRSCNNHREVLEKMMKLCGALPERLRQQGRLTKVYFSDKGFHPEVGNPVPPEKYKKRSMFSELAPHANFGTAKGLTAQEQAKAQLSKLIGATTVVSAASKRVSGPTESEKKLQLLAELVEQCMDVDPSTRASAATAVDHVIFQDVERPPCIEPLEVALPAEPPPPLPPAAVQPPSPPQPPQPADDPEL